MNRFTLTPLMRRFFTAICVAMLTILAACAIGPKQAFHGFSFDGKSDRWATQVDLLEYSYGDQYRMVRDKVQPPKERLGPQSSVFGAMPIGEFLFVKWRIKATGEVIEDRVDLRNLLPSDMEKYKVTFVIDGKQLHVFLVTPKAKHEYDLPILKTTESRYLVTREIYPVNTHK